MALTKTPIELSSTPSIVDGGNATAITIDSSENVLVGKTVSNDNVSGTQIYGGANAGIVSSTFAGRPLYLNRLTTDGDIIDFAKDGATVGSIGVAAGPVAYMVFNETTSDNVAALKGAGRAILPSTNAGADKDGTMNLGSSGARFNDLYLSGGAYLGGTAAANALDDYEEGTWTPVLTKSTTAPSVTYNHQIGTYTKVGRMTYVSGLLSWTAISGGTGDFRIADLPFTILSSIGAYPQMVSTDYSGVTFGANDATFGGYGATNGTHILLLAAKNNGTTSLAISGLATSGFIYFNLTYQAA